jgi:type III restriction enzyme
MVRAPLVRRVTEDERLNGVGLYLPYYNAANVRTVVEHLTGAGEAAAAVDVVEADKVVALPRAGGTEAIFTALEALPHYTVPRTRRTSDVRRLDALARALAIDEIDAEAVGRERSRLVDVLLAARGRLADDAAFQEAVAERGTIKVRKVEWIYGETATADETAETFTLEVSEENVATLFAAAGRSLGGEVHQGYWEARAAQDAAARTTGRLELVALASRPDIRSELERAAQIRIRELFEARGAAIDDLPGGRRTVYTTIQGSSADPEPRAFRPPEERADFPVGEEAWERHAYADESGEARVELGSAWEVEALRAALIGPGTVAWLRNVPRKDWAFCVPYQVGTEWRPFYPDFLIVRETGNGLRVDILDPHNPTLADAHNKAKGLAKFAADHGHRFGRIGVVAKVGNELVSLDLKDQTTRERVSQADSPAALRAIFAAP